MTSISRSGAGRSPGEGSRQTRSQSAGSNWRTPGRAPPVAKRRGEMRPTRRASRTSTTRRQVLSPATASSSMVARSTKAPVRRAGGAASRETVASACPASQRTTAWVVAPGSSARSSPVSTRSRTVVTPGRPTSGPERRSRTATGDDGGATAGPRTRTGRRGSTPRIETLGTARSAGREAASITGFAASAVSGSGARSRSAEPVRNSLSTTTTVRPRAESAAAAAWMEANAPAISARLSVVSRRARWAVTAARSEEAGTMSGCDGPPRAINPARSPPVAESWSMRAVAAFLWRSRAESGPSCAEAVRLLSTTM